MPRQDLTFLDEEGDRWYQRNLAHSALTPDARGKDDVVLQALTAVNLRPKRTLEIGCSNGWRLTLIQRLFGGECHGLDPSAQAIAAGAREFPGIQLVRGSAHVLPYAAGHFELVLLPGILYLCDRDQLFQIASEMDRVLADGGHLLIADFVSATPFRNPYVHQAGLYSYKMTYRRMFDWNPVYGLIYSRMHPYPQSGTLDDPDGRYAVDVLRKDLTHAYPNNPYTGTK